MASCMGAETARRPHRACFGRAAIRSATALPLSAFVVVWSLGLAILGVPVAGDDSEREGLPIFSSAGPALVASVAVPLAGAPTSPERSGAAERERLVLFASMVRAALGPDDQLVAADVVTSRTLQAAAASSDPEGLSRQAARLGVRVLAKLEFDGRLLILTLVDTLDGSVQTQALPVGPAGPGQPDSDDARAVACVVIEEARRIITRGSPFEGRTLQRS